MFCDRARARVLLLSTLIVVWRIGNSVPIQLDKSEEDLLTDINSQEELQVNLQASELQPVQEKQEIAWKDILKETYPPLRPSKEEVYIPEGPVDIVTLIDFVVRRVQDEIVDSYSGLTECSIHCGNDGVLDIQMCLMCIAPSFENINPISVYHE